MDLEVILLICGFILIAIYIAFDNQRKTKAGIEKKLKSSYGKPSKRKYSEDDYELISHYYEDCAQKSDFVVDDITWNDLGMDAIFKRMNITNSSVGQEYLYKMLRIPSNDTKVLKETDRLAEFFDANPDVRMSVQKEYVNMGYARHISVSDYIGLLVELKSDSNFIHYVSGVFLVFALAVCLLFNATIGIMLMIAAVSLSIISYYKYKAKVEPYFMCIIQLVKMLNTADSISKLGYKELETYNAEFKEICGSFSNVVKNSGLIVSGNVNGSLAEMVLEYVRMFTHVDLIKFNNMVKQLGRREDDVYRLMDRLGFIEACISVASFRRMLSYWSKPVFDEKHSGNTNVHMDLKEAYHPMIENFVANSIYADKHILLTGSNASGKSTFLKTVAINALLSQAIYTSVSKEYRAPMFRIYSSMSLRDDLSNNNSYYIVEIKSLKRILDAVASESDMPVLCFVDEVLRGTNTVERIAASSEILKSLRYQNVLCFAATHDIELTSLLEKYYYNYHFQEEVTDDDVKFNYKLFKGPATTRNAIKLLNIIGYNKEIINAAERQAGYFLENGKWS